MWTRVSVTLEQDGKKTEMYGANPQGHAILAPNGCFFFHNVYSFVSDGRRSNKIPYAYPVVSAQLNMLGSGLG